MKVILTGGGTGGHFFPLTALAQSLQERKIEILIVGRRHSWEEKYCLEFNLPFQGILTGKRAGKFSLQNLKAVLKLTQGFFETLRVFRRFRPGIIVGSGGYVSFPVLLAGFFSRLPLLIHEQNVLPGLTARFFAPLAGEITLGFTETSKYFSQRLKKKIFVTGSPLRKSVEPKENTGSDFKSFGLKKDKFTLLVMGGSQGAHRLNLLVLETQKIWQKENLLIQIIHLTGEKDYRFVKEVYIKAGFKAAVFPFYDDMGGIYSIVDLAVVRGGAVTLAELSAWGIASVIIPYPYAAAGHQELNAHFFARAGAAKVFSEKDLTPRFLSREVSSLVKNNDLLKVMAEASKKLNRDNSRDVLTERIIRLAKTSKRSVSHV